ncbi:MAG: phosphosulfolactate synthase [Bacteroidota bacterium]
MNFNLPHLPDRSQKPRKNGINMIMDKGLSIREVEDFISATAELVDYVKLGFGTSIVTKNLNQKIKLYKDAGINPYFGGTLFEVFYIRGLLDDYKKYLEKFEIQTVEVSDGEVQIPADKKCEIIRNFSKDFTVLSEVGSKEADVIIPVEKWIEMMINEKQAGSVKVIAEAREAGTIGIYNKDGSTNTELVDSIRKNVSIDDIIWEAPMKSQQAWFIKQMGTNVNLGNIPHNEVIALETLRLGLRGDTFFQFIPDLI